MWPAKFLGESTSILLDTQQDLEDHLIEPDPDIYEHKYIHCDVLSYRCWYYRSNCCKNSRQEINLKTLLLDEKNEIGGSTIYQNSDHIKINDQNSSTWLENEIKELEKYRKFRS